MTYVEKIEGKKIGKKANKSKKAQIKDGSSSYSAFRPKFHQDRVPNPEYHGECASVQIFPTCHK